MTYITTTDAQCILRLSGLIYCGEGMTVLRILNVGFKIRSVLSEFMISYDSSELSTAVTREKFTLLGFDLLSLGQSG